MNRPYFNFYSEHQPSEAIRLLSVFNSNWVVRVLCRQVLTQSIYSSTVKFIVMCWYNYHITETIIKAIGSLFLCCW